MDTGASSYLADNTDGSLSMYKARLVANGCIQQQASSTALLQRIITLLHSEFAMTDLGTLNYFLDADWAGCPVTRRSTSGYYVFFVDNLLSWSAKWHVTLSRSSAEAEYHGVENVIAETAWIQNLLLEIHVSLTTATLFYCDNRTKRIEIDIHFVRDYVAFGEVRVHHVPSRF
nr:hypothetical protein [Tanacetum cinerariifolium]